MNICGTVRRPPLSSIMRAFSAASNITSISVNSAPLPASRRLAAEQ